MSSKLVLLCSLLVCTTMSLPTMYKFNENKILEADLVPVSSTVIPLPVYEVSHGLYVASSIDEKVKKPEGPVKLVTVHTKKKVQQTKAKASDVSSVKEVSQNDFHN